MLLLTAMQVVPWGQRLLAWVWEYPKASMLAVERPHAGAIGEENSQAQKLGSCLSKRRVRIL